MRIDQSRIAGCVVRRARVTDRDPLATLLVRSAITDERSAPMAAYALLSRGRLFVIDTVSGSLGGAIHVDVAGQIGRIDLLAVDPDLGAERLDARLYTFAEAVCQHLGCTRIELGHAA
jgi:hypothetical protein